MNLRELKELIALFEESGVTELELEREGVRVRLSKSGGAPTQVVYAPAPVAPQVAAPPAPGQPQPQPPPAQEEGAGLSQIVSPMVGTFYRAPAPGAEPFVVEGQQVTPDTTVCIIEAMKLMNEIKAEMSGRIVKVLVENGQPVEYGQPLFLVEPAG